MNTATQDIEMAIKVPRDVLSSKKHQGAGFRAFFNLAEAWKLSPSQGMSLLGDIEKGKYYKLRKGALGHVPTDTMRRISYLIGIHKALRILYKNPDNLYGWVNQANDKFGGQSPIDRMVSGDLTDLAYVRQYLDQVRG